MRANHVEQPVMIVTDGERIEGTVFHLNGMRLSDFFNSEAQQQQAPFVKIKDATLSCRRTGQELGRAPFMMVARDRIVLVMMQAIDADDRLSVA